jgi:hypothetical protein
MFCEGEEGLEEGSYILDLKYHGGGNKIEKVWEVPCAGNSVGDEDWVGSEIEHM